MSTQVDSAGAITLSLSRERPASTQNGFAMLFAMLGRVVDSLSHVAPGELWTRERGALLLLGAALIVSPVLVALRVRIAMRSSIR